MPRRNEGPKLKFLAKRGCFYIVWTEHGRSRERSTGTADSAAAQIEFARFLQRFTRKLGPRDPSEILMTDILTDYLEKLEANGKDGERAAYAVTPLSEFFAGRSVAEVPGLVDAYTRWRGRSLSTVRRELGIVQCAIREALLDQKLTRQVALKRPPESPPKSRWLTRSEAAMLLAGALGFSPIAYDAATRLPSKWSRVSRPQYHLAMFILIGLYTGRRKEAILSLRWSKVDFERRRMDFLRDGLPETKKKRGGCRIPPRLLPHLKRAKGHPHNVGHVIIWSGNSIDDLQTSFSSAAARVYLKGISPHTLKHTAASWLMQSGMDVFKASEFLATSVQTLLKHYAHHRPDHQDEAAEAIGSRPGNVRRIR